MYIFVSLLPLTANLQTTEYGSKRKGVWVQQTHIYMNKRVCKPSSSRKNKNKDSCDNFCKKKFKKSNKKAKRKYK